MMKRTAAFLAFGFLTACGSAPKSDVPSLTPQTATELLHYDNSAKNWMTFVKRNNPACDYSLQLPDQSSHPTEIDLDHIVSCGGRPSPKEYDASVVFLYDKAAGHWTVSRFSS